MAKTAPVPCVIRDADAATLAEEDSLAENVQRAPLHPLDQFRAFQTLREKGLSEEEIAATFFIGVNVVRQRLRLAAVSEKLLEVYADDGMELEQLIRSMRLPRRSGCRVRMPFHIFKRARIGALGRSSRGARYRHGARSHWSQS